MGCQGLMPFGLESEQRTRERDGPSQAVGGGWWISIPRRPVFVSDQLPFGKALRQAIERAFSILPGKLDELIPGPAGRPRSIQTIRTRLMPLLNFDCLSLRRCCLGAEQRRKRPDCFRGQKSSGSALGVFCRNLRDTMPPPVD